jgi:hypothetical protein
MKSAEQMDYDQIWVAEDSVLCFDSEEESTVEAEILEVLYGQMSWLFLNV